MSEGPSIKGEKQEVKNGLFQIQCDADNGKLIAFWNSTKDLQFNMAYQFLEPNIVALGETQSQDDKYAVVVYPGETKEFVKGKWKAFKRSFSFGAPDAEWVSKQAALLNDGVDKELADVKAAVKANPKADGKDTAEYIAAVCESAGVPFVDLTFVPKASSVSRDWEGAAPPFAWMRPSAYCTDPDKPPCLFVGKIEPNDIDQGRLGNCYFLCALACISEFEEVTKTCFNEPQNPQLGVYRVRICKNGWWQVVTMDDLLPTERNIPVYAKNREEPNELWVSMIEKAYAKVHGSYAAIRAGDPAQAMSDMVGGPYLKFKDHPDWNDPEASFKFLLKCDEDDHLMTLGTPGSDTTNYSGGAAAGGGAADELAEKYKKVGLVTGHAFSLIRVKEYQGRKMCMIRNPWGNGMEWNGKWADSDPSWTPEMKKALDFYDGDDGTFWMEWDDVRQWFDNGSVCYVLPTYSSVRVAANFENGIPDLVLQVTVNKAAVECFFGAHQRDNRGLPSGDKDRKYVGILLSVLKVDEASGKCSATLTSNKGNFAPSRDVFAIGKLEPSEKPYYLLVQAFGSETKSFVISSFFSDDKNVKVSFVSFKEGQAKKYNPPSNFEPAACSQKAAGNYQLVTQRSGDRFLELQGDSVNFLAGPEPTKTAPATAAAGKSRATPSGTSSKGPAAAPTKAPMTAPAPAVAKFKVTVTVLSGRNLVAKDIGGSSDPFITITVHGADGKPLSDVDEVSTKYINSTLNPTWGEQFSFNVPANAVFQFHCWDKDLFGKDDMGAVAIPLGSLGLQPGGAAKMDHYALKGGDATGDIQLLFTPA
jgi:hypothetical protein